MQAIAWNQVVIGDTVFIDNYQDGQFPKANPRISGPFKVVRGNGTGRCLQTMKPNWNKQRTFMHYPDDLLK